MKICPKKLLFACSAILLCLSLDSFSTNVPPQYIVYSVDSLRIGDRAGTDGSGWIGSSTVINIGSDARVNGPVFSTGNVNLYDRCIVNGNITAGGLINRTFGVVVNGSLSPNTPVPVYTIPTKTFSTGTQNITVPLDSTRVFQAGNYGNITILERATVTFQSGVYNVKSLRIGNDVDLRLAFPANGTIEVNCSGDLTFGDRVVTSFTQSQNSYAVSFYSGGTNTVYLGFNGVFYGAYSAPNAKVVLHDRSQFTGTIHAKKVELQPSVFYEADTQSPNLRISQPTYGSYLSTKTPRVVVKFSDNMAGVDLSTLRIFVRGTDRTSYFQVNGDSAVWQIPVSMELPEGQNTITADIADRSANITHTECKFKVDSTQPTISFSTPHDGDTSRVDTPYVSIVYSDTVSGIKLSTFKVLLNSVDITNKFTQSNSGAYYQMGSSNRLPNGTSTFSATVSDSCGNLKSVAVAYTVYRTNPVVVITSPVEGAVSNQNPVTVRWMVNGIEQSTQTSQTLIEGANSITRTFTDNYGNTGADTVHVTLDTQVPVVAITSPEDGFITNQNSVNVIWTVDGIEQTTQLTQNLTEGDNTIIRSFTDSAGNNGADTVHVTLDTKAPEVAITSPADGFITNQNQVNVSWTVDGIEQTTQLIQNLTEGDNSIIRSYTDVAGNIGEDTVHVTLDTQVPVVAITSPVDGFITNQNTVNVTWTVDGTSQTTQLTQTLTEGDNAIIRSYTDAAGNTDADTVHVTLDTQVPVVAITSPANGFITNQNPVNVTWTVDGIAQTTQLIQNLTEGDNAIIRSYTDAAGNIGADTVHVTLDTQASVVAITSPVDGFITNQNPVNVTWTLDGIAQMTQLIQNLTEGDNSIIRSYTDAAGNTDADTVHVTLDTQAPVVAITSPLDGFITNQNTVNVTWTVDVITQTTQLTQTLTEGDNAIIRSYTDAAGNIGADTIYVVYNASTPSPVKITWPYDSFITNQWTLNIEWKINGETQSELISEDLIEGNNIIRRSYTDTNGVIWYDSVHVVLDILPPEFEIQVQPEPIMIPGEGSTIKVKWCDNISEISHTSFKAYLNGIDITSRFTYMRDSALYQINTFDPLTYGWNELYTSISDSAGNVGYYWYYISCENPVKPVVTIISPQRGVTFRENSISVKWSINGVIQDYDTTEHLYEGWNTIYRYAYIDGGWGYDTLSVFLDTHLPSVKIVSPYDGFKTKDKISKVEWLVDNIPQNTQTTETLTVDGINTIVRSYTNNYGEMYSDSISVMLDTQKPLLSFIPSGSIESVIDTPEIILRWSDLTSGVDLQSLRIFLNNKEVTSKFSIGSDSAIWQIRKSESLSLGLNKFNASISDSAGNIGAINLTVTVQSENPVVKIIYPIDGAKINSNPVKVVWTIDNVTQTSQLSESLAEGENLIIRRHLSGSGELSADTVHVTYHQNIRGVMVNGQIINGMTLEPISGATVSIADNGISTITNSEGYYSFPTGRFDVLRVKVEHAGFTSAMRLISADTAVDLKLDPIMIIPLNTETVAVSSGIDTSFMLHSNGVEFDIPHTALNEKTSISATIYSDIDQLPNVQPEMDLFLFCVDLKPNGATFTDSITVRVPNLNRLSARAPVPITYFNEQTALWDPAGTGYVTEDGNSIEFKVIHFSTYHGNEHSNKDLDDDDHEDEDTPNDDADTKNENEECPVNSGASEVTLKTGDLSLDYVIPGGKAFTDIDVKLVYWSAAANPRSVFTYGSSYIPMTPTYMAWNIYVPGISKTWGFYGPDAPYNLSFILMRDSVNILETGLYPYGYIASDILNPGSYRYRSDLPENRYLYTMTGIQRNTYYYGFKTIINRENSPYGSGWSIEGVNELVKSKTKLASFNWLGSAYRSKETGLPISCETGDTIRDHRPYATGLGETKGSLWDSHISIIGSGLQGKIFWYNRTLDRYISANDVNDYITLSNNEWIRNLSNGAKETYDTNGLLLSKTDLDNNTTIYSYYSGSRLLHKITDIKSGKFTELFYSEGKLSGITDQYGRITSIQIDEAGDLKTITTPDNIPVRQFAYDKHRTITKKLSTGAFSSYSYNKFGSIVQTKSPSGLITNYKRSSDNGIVNDLPESKRDVRIDYFYFLRGGGTRTMGNLVFTDTTVKCSTTIYYRSYMPAYKLSAADDKYSFSDNLGGGKEYTFDSYGRLLSEVNSGIVKTLYEYNNSSCNCGSASTVTYPNGLIIKKMFDDENNLIRQNNLATGDSTLYNYVKIKGVNYISSITNALGQSTSFEYDTLGHITRILKPGNDTFEIAYQSNLPTEIKDPLNRVTRTVYDSLGRVIYSITPSNDTTTYSYDSRGNLNRIISPDNRSTVYTYDIMDRLLTETNPAQDVTRYTYDNYGLLDTLIDPKGNRTYFSYDSIGNLIKSTNHLGISKQYSYNEHSALITYINGRNQSINYKYNVLGNLIEKVTGDSVFARFGYDNAGNMTFAQNKSHTVNRTFDTAGRIVKENITRVLMKDTITDDLIIGSDDFSRDYTDIVINRANVIVDGTHHFKSIRLVNGAAISHLPTDAATIHKMNITASDSIVIDNTSSINVDGKGYPGGNRDGNTSNIGITNYGTTISGSNAGSGGSHGGRGSPFIFDWGMQNTVIGFAAHCYDNYLWPILPGGGGGTNGNAGFNGGGVIYLGAPRIVLNGTVSANGESCANDNGGAGAGGSIIIDATVIDGAGYISANGGNGLEGVEMPEGGGGGRIVLRYSLSSSVDVSAYGGSFGGESGSIVYMDKQNKINSQKMGSITFSDDSLNIDADNQVYEYKDVIVNGSKVVINGKHQFNSLRLVNGAVLSHDNIKDTSDRGIVLEIKESLSIDSSSMIDVTGKGYAGAHDSVPALTRKFVKGALGKSGGSYGGKGGEVDSTTNNPYGSPSMPLDFGSGGGKGSADSSRGGNGGGIVYIKASNIFLNGQIIANGENSNDGGAGSGGSITIESSTINGKGTLSVTGGSSRNGGGGSGGRVALYGNYSRFNVDDAIYFSGGFGAKLGGSGTVYFGDNGLYADPLNARYVFKNVSISIDSITDSIVKNVPLLFDNSTVTIDGHCTLKSIVLRKGSVITHNQGASGLFLTTEFLSIDNSSSIDVSGKGYPGDRFVNDAWTGARTVGNIIGSTNGAGGSYGGLGYGTGANPIYGDPINPNELGSGGSTDRIYTDVQGGDGGGLVKISTKRLDIDGSILANGTNTNSYWGYGGGSGGGISITADSITGNGIINANAEKGGGGRIAIVARHVFTLNSENVAAVSNSYGQNGTVFIDHPENDSLRTVQFIAHSDQNGTGLVISNSTYNSYSLKIRGNLTINGDHSYRALYAINAKICFNGNSFVDTIITNNSTITFNDTINSKSMEFLNNTIITHRGADTAHEYRLTLITDNILIDSTSKIDVNGKGYLGDRYINGAWTGARTLGNAIGSINGAAGSYGGRGYGAGSNLTYGDPFNPNEPGSGGSCGRSYTTYYGGSGGGLVRIAANKLTLNGIIQADGQNYTDFYYGTGSGGGVLIVADSIIGIGSISASSPQYGGGGRVAVYARGYYAFNSANVKANCANPSYGQRGSVIIVPPASDSMLVMNNASNVSRTDSIGIVISDTAYDGYALKINGNGLAISGDHHYRSLHAANSNISINGNATIDTIITNNSKITFNGKTQSRTITFTNSIVEGNDSIISSGSITALTNTTFTHRGADTAHEYRLTLITDNILIDSTSKIDVNGKGYLGDRYINGAWTGARTLGNAIGSINGAAGSYGGRGYGAGSNLTYGDPFNPNEPGSGGSCGRSYTTYYGGSGGGLVRITANKLTLNGIIQADGQNYTDFYYGTGSGGGVLIVADSIIGIGSISASSPQYGGGGRVAVYARGYYAFNSANVKANCANPSYGQRGSVIIVPPASDSMLVMNNASNVSRTDSIGIVISDTAYDGYALKINGNGLAISGDHHYRSLHAANSNISINGNATIDTIITNNSKITFNGKTQSRTITFTNSIVEGNDSIISSGSITALTNTTFTHRGADTAHEYRLTLITDNILIDSTSKIDVNGKGYLGDRYINGAWTGARTLGNAIGSINGAAGSYGGRGYGAGSNLTYGDPFNPNEPGSGGSCGRSYTTYYGGSGGGLVRITANKLTLNGIIQADGQNYTDFYYGTGSGGGVLIVADSIIGIGSISASSPQYGGGGRVAVYARGYYAFNSANVKANCANPSYGQRGSVIIVPPASDSMLVMNNASNVSRTDSIGIVISDTAYDGYALKINGNGLAISGDHHYRSLHAANSNISINGNATIDTIITNNSKITFNGKTQSRTITFTNSIVEGNDSIISSGSITALTNTTFTHRGADTAHEYRLTLITDNILIDSTSKIDVNGKGYLGDRYINGAWTGARTLGNAIGSINGAAGSYGGRGYGAGSNPTYGDPFNPNEPGSGGSCGRSYTTYYGGSGGGLVRITANKFTLNGIIQADGQNYADFYYGTGSGGGVLIVADSIIGIGSISASSPQYGGGGRVAVFARDYYAFNSANVKANCANPSYGQRGSVIIVPPASDSMLVMNNALNVSRTDSIGIVISDTAYDGYALKINGNGLAINGDHHYRSLHATNSNISINGNATIDTIITNNSKITFNGKTQSRTITFTNSIVEGNDSIISSGSITALTNTTFTHRGADTAHDYRLTLITDNLLIDSTSKIDVNGKGYLGDRYINGAWTGARTLGNAIGSVNTAAGSYGGRGYGAGSNPTYGDPFNPNEPGSGGSCGRSYTTYYGGSGGGLVRIAANKFTLNGIIQADGQQQVDIYNTTGSGGGVFIVTDSVNGSGSISANSPSYGGGGRIAITTKHYCGLEISKIRVNGYQPGSIQIYTSDIIQEVFPDINQFAVVSDQQIIINNDQTNIQSDLNLSNGAFTTFAMSDTGKNINLRGNSTLEFTGKARIKNLTINELSTVVMNHDTLFADTIRIINGKITHNSLVNPNGTIKPRFTKVTLDAKTIIIDSLGSIDAAGKGYAAGLTINGALTTSNVRTPDIAGTHAGRGGKATSLQYGNYSTPELPGSGGGIQSAGAEGGGIICINAEKVINKGLISANGLNAVQDVGSGAGGSIWITADNITGTGSIIANGGTASTLAQAGGGGRIALHTKTIDQIILQNSSASGASAGTIYVKTLNSVHGNLILDNKNVVSEDSSSMIAALGSGTIFRIVKDTVICDTCRFPVYMANTESSEKLPGLHAVTFEIASSDSADLKRQFTVLWNDSTRLVLDTAISGSLLNLFKAGDKVNGVINLDTLIIINGARAFTPDSLYYRYLELRDGKLSDPVHHEQTGFLDMNFPADTIKEKSASVTGADPLKKSTTQSASEKAKPVQVACAAGDPVYSYDVISRVTTMTSPAGITQYIYDTITGALSKIISPEGKEFTYNYTHGQIDSLGLPNGIIASYQFNQNGSLTGLHYDRNGTNVKHYDYRYDKNEMRTSMTDNDGTHNYTYDPLYQILNATHPSVKNPLEQFAYDAAGNWLNDNRVHNELNQLLEDDSCYYRYDLDGNMTEKISKATNDTIHFVWDIENKLTEVRKPGLLVKYEYDAIGRRVSKEVNGFVTQLRYDGEDMILEMDSQDSLIANYTFGPGIDDPLMMHRDSNNYYYVKDGLGSVTALTDGTGNTVKEYKYGVFGIITDESGDSTLWNPFTYTSREWEKELGTYFYRARYYDPEMGRFLSEDPIGFGGGDINIYRYVYNSSTNYSDPFGYKVKFGGSPTFQEKIKQVYNKVKSTKHGNAMCEILEKRKETYRIDQDWEDAKYYPREKTIRIDLNWHPEVEIEGGYKKSSSEGLLAHELGHAFGEMDEDVNFRTNENPVTTELGEKPRTIYESDRQ